ncbi:histidine ammonia-lyase [Microbacterium sp. RG1]|uniref:histidine ammonia-lyase n=1 Tax=Microbacterium sp. RG1 TaxID=2489212 RepID=UPI0010CA2306|nr:histidine ammonia-lyase [Microbacterium sp. RG1]QCQ15890.1 histidine ammonia-lyase [Microbacterium sp. RG1]
MGITFPSGSITVRTAADEVVILHICDLCGAVVAEADDTDLAFHKRWHRMTGSGNWIDPETGRVHSSGGTVRPDASRS